MKPESLLGPPSIQPETLATDPNNANRRVTYVTNQATHKHNVLLKHLRPGRSRRIHMI